jgi:predicted MFS family arabinose efflux permease
MRSIIGHYQDAFRGIPWPVWKISIAALVNRAGTMVLPFLSLYLVKQRGFDAGQVATLLLVFGLGSVVGSWTGGRLADRFGGIPVQIGCLATSGIAFLVLGQLREYFSILVGVFIVSALADGFRPACMVSVIHRTPEAVRVRAFALLRLMLNIGMSLGPALGGILAAWNYQWLFVVEGATCISAAVFLAVTVRDRTPHEQAASRGGVVKTGLPAWRDKRFVIFLVVIFVSGMAIFQIFSTVPLYLSDSYNMGEESIGLVFGFNAVLIVLFEMLIVKMFENRNKVRIIGAGCLLICFGLGLMGLGNTMVWALFTVLIWTVGEMLMLPFASGEVASLAGQGRSGEYMGWYTSTFSAAFVVGPPVGMAIYSRFGGPPLMIVVAALGPICWLGCAWLAKQDETVTANASR